MFSHIKKDEIKLNNQQILKDVNIILGIIQKNKEKIEKLLKNKGRFTICDISSNSIAFDLKIQNFKEHWNKVEEILEDKLGLCVFGYPRFEYDYDKLGNIGILEMTFVIKNHD